jgi:hypothetical protein
MSPAHVEGLNCDAPTAFAYLLRPLTILRAYRPGYLRPDILAGLTVAAVAITQAIAYASIAELPPHCGLYTAAIGAIVGSLWGGSRFLATGPVNASSLLVLPVLLAVAVPGTATYLLAASALAMMAGIFRIVPVLLRFGAVVTLASRSASGIGRGWRFRKDRDRDATFEERDHPFLDRGPVRVVPGREVRFPGQRSSDPCRQRRRGRWPELPGIPLGAHGGDHPRGDRVAPA